MSDIALYYPYVNLPGDAWVKAAALHWPQLARIRPSGYYRLRDSDTVERLRDELDFVVDVGPVGALRLGDQVGELFYDFLARHQDELIPRFGAEVLGVESLRTCDVYDQLLPLDPRFEEVHPGKMSYGLAQELADAGLLVSRRYRWRRADDGKVLNISDLAMHRRLAGVYLAVLAEVIARRNGMTPVTDQALNCAAASGWTVENMARILLSDEDPAPEHAADHGQVFALLALQTVVPRDLADVPVERIIEARRRLLPDLLRYREFLDSLTPDFVEISAVPDPEVRAAKLRNHIERRIAEPIETMERELGRLGLQPARAVLSLQTLAPPTALGVLANAVDLPPVVTGAGVVAGCLVGAAHSAFDQRRKVLAEHPAGYLLNLRRELGPADAVARIRSAIRRATPRRRTKF